MNEELRHKMEVKKNGKMYVFEIPFQSPIPEAQEACKDFLAKIEEYAAQSKEKEAAAQQNEKSEEK